MVEQLVLTVEIGFGKTGPGVRAHLEEVRVKTGVELGLSRSALVARLRCIERSGIDGRLRGTHAGSLGVPGNMGPPRAHASAASTARCHSGTRARAAVPPVPGEKRVKVRLARKSSGRAQTFPAIPANPAAPRDVVSTRSGRATGTFKTSA